jgi:Flp pilus assembly protein TadB
VASCPRCTSTIPASAQFCPRCGEARPARASSQDEPVHDWRPGVPWAGIAFVLAIVLAPAAVISGFWWHSPALIWTGVITTVAILLVVVLAHFC